MKLIGTNAEKDTVFVELRSAEWEALRALQDAIDNSEHCSTEALRQMGVSTSITPYLITARKFIFSLQQLARMRSLVNETIRAIEENTRQRPEDDLNWR